MLNTFSFRKVIAEKRKYLIMIEDVGLLATVMNRHLEEKYSQF